MTLQGSAVT